MALTGVMEAAPPGPRHLITSAFEHPAILETCRWPHDSPHFLYPTSCADSGRFPTSGMDRRHGHGNGTASRLGVMQRWPSAGTYRSLRRISVRIRNRAYRYRQRSEPAAGGRHRVGSSASAVPCSAVHQEIGRPFGDGRSHPQASTVTLGVIDGPIALADEIAVQRELCGP